MKPTLTDTTESGYVDFSVILNPLDSLLAAIENKIEREWPAQFRGVLGARELVLVTLKTANITYRSIRFLCAEKSSDPFRRLEYGISIPPLNRTILDNLFTLIFIFEDLPSRTRWYFRADWREARLELERYQAEFGNIAVWQEWLGRLGAYSKAGEILFQISPAEIANPKMLLRWPNPGRMVNYGVSPKSTLPPARPFLKYLHDWFYADMSQQAHLGGGGLAKRAGALLHNPNDPERDKSMFRARRAGVAQTVVLILALATEIEVYFDFGLRDRLRYIWGLASPLMAIAKELYDKRYAKVLGVT
jgi:hypothetical protein